MIQCINVKKKMVTKTVLEDVTFTINGPKIVGLIGRNGVGKSTLMQLLAGLTPPTKGHVNVLGHEAFDDLFVATNTIYVHPQTTFPAHLTLKEICHMAAQFYVNWQQSLVEKLLQYFQIPLQLTFDHLSTGMQAIFKTVFALSARAQVTLLDEPANGVDEGLRYDLYRAILKEYIAHPRLIIMSSHLLDEMAHLLEDIIILHDGKVLVHTEITEFSELYVAWKGNLAEMLAVYPDAKVLPTTPFGDQRVLVPGDVDGPFDVQHLTAKELYLQLTSEQKGTIDDVYTNVNE